MVLAKEVFPLASKGLFEGGDFDDDGRGARSTGAGGDRGKRVVRGLRHIDMVVGVDWRLAGHGYWPDANFRPVAEQENRTDTLANDPWFDVVAEWVERQTAKSFKCCEILKGALNIPEERMDKKAERRLGAILRHLEYTSKGGRAGRRWEKPEAERERIFGNG